MRRSPESLLRRTAEAFAARYGRAPAACGVGPGRVEILGNHTDYNGGSVLTAAIDRHVVAVGRPIADPVVRVHALDLTASAEFRLDTLSPEGGADWSNYVKAVFAVLRQAGVRLGGMELAVAGDVPLGAGLSSSAALEAAVATLILRMHPHPLEKLELARLLQRGENEFTGVRCGLLDQFAALHGEADRVIFLNCLTGAHETLTLGSPAPALVLCHSGVSRELGQSASYNLRRAECEQAAACLSRLLGRPVPGLCTISSAELARLAPEVPEPWRSRARHVIAEHERVLAAREFLCQGAVDRLGPLLAESHASSRTLFENSCPALDRLCAAAARQEGCLGARLCGAGWGGCILALVVPEAVETFVAGLRQAPELSTLSPVDIQVCRASPGARAWYL